MQGFNEDIITTPSAPPPLYHPLVNCDMYHQYSPFFLRGDERDHTRFGDLGELDQSAGFHQDDAFVLSTRNVAVFSSNFQFRGHNANYSSMEMAATQTGLGESGQFISPKETVTVASSGAGSGYMGNGNFENWGESVLVADNNSQHTTDTSTDVDTDDKIQFPGVQQGAMAVIDSNDQSNGRIGDQKTLRRLAQNREAARKSRMRKKAYVQQLENSRLRLSQLEQDLRRARQQGMFGTAGLPSDQNLSVGGNGGALAFDMEYTRWQEEHERQIVDLRAAVNIHAGDNELRILVDAMLSHYDELFRLKNAATKSDVFHMLSGMWKTPAERCFMWLGGFRSSELLKILGNHLDPLSDQQIMGICNLQQSSQQAEDALSQGMEALQQTLSDTLSCNNVGPAGSGNVADYMGQMAIAMSKLTTIENFLHQADLLRQQTLHQMHRILTIRQSARALLVVSDYTSRLRALSSLWLARPKN